MSLPHYTFNQALLHLHKLLSFPLLQVGNRNSCPDGNHLCYVFLSHFLLEQGGLTSCGELGVVLFQLGRQIGNAAVLNLARPGKVPLPLSDLEFIFQRLDFFVDLL